MTEPPLRRREAAPLSEADFTTGQRLAFERAVAIVEAAAASGETAEEPSKERPSLVVLDGRRTNNVLLIDGGRGSGKTTVLLSLLRRFRERLAAPIEPGGERAEAAAVPLELIDLQPLSNTVNLLLFVLGRLLRVVEELELLALEPAGRGRFSASGEGELPSRAAWRELADAVAIGWSVDLGRRSGSVDLEQFAVELDRSTRVGVELTRHFRRFVNGLTDDYARAFGQRPLFVIPIDDADMNPRRAVELVELLRNLWHPRVAFVLTGHSQLFLACLRAHYLGELRRAISERTVTRSELESLGHQADHVSLAVEVYHRVIPPSHRCQLLELDPKERLEIPLDVFDRVDGAPISQKNLELKLAAFAVGDTTLGELVRRLPQYAEMLPTRLRTLKDLDTDLDPPRGFAHATSELWRYAVQRSTLSPEEQAEVLRTVAIDAARGGLRVAASRVEWQDQSRVLRRRDDPGGFEVTELLQTRVDATVVRADGVRIALPEAVTAALLFAIAVAARTPETSLFLGEWPTRSLVPRLVRRRRYSAAARAHVELSWPVPSWPTLESYHELGRLWAERRDWLKDWSWPAYAFVATIVEIATGTAPTFVAQVEAAQRASATKPSIGRSAWDELAERVADVALRRASDRPADRASADWALRAALLFAAPEYATDAQELWIDGLRRAFGAREIAWDQARESAQHERRERVRASLGQGAGADLADAILGELDQRSDTFAKEMLRVVADVLAPLRAALATIPVRLPASAALPPSLVKDATAYLTPSREAILRALPAAEIASMAERLAGQRTPAWRLLRLWQQVARTSQHRASVHREGGRLRVLASYAHKSEPIDHGDVDEERELSVAEVRSALSISGSDDVLTAAEHVILRVLSDLAADEHDAESDDVEPVAYEWPGVEVTFRGRLGWPTVAWPAPYDRELLEQSWAQWGEGAAEAIGASAQENAKLADALALRYLVCIDTIFRSRQADLGKWESQEPKEGDWKRVLDLLQTALVTPIGAPLASSLGRRARSLHAFLGRLVTFADPRAGLTLDASNAIVAHLTQLYAPGTLFREQVDRPVSWTSSAYFDLPTRPLP